MMPTDGSPPQRSVLGFRSSPMTASSATCPGSNSRPSNLTEVEHLAIVETGSPYRIFETASLHHDVVALIARPDATGFERNAGVPSWVSRSAPPVPVGLDPLGAIMCLHGHGQIDDRDGLAVLGTRTYRDDLAHGVQLYMVPQRATNSKAWRQPITQGPTI